jgi:hypothetical protein
MTKIEYNGSIVATVESGNTATLPIKDKKMKSDIVITVPEAEVATHSPLPTEVSTEAEMTALLESGEVGGVYKYTGTTGTYESGALYVLEAELGTFTYTQSQAWYSTPIVRQFPLGMTWGEFIESDYNSIQTDGSGQGTVTGQFVIEGSFVKFTGVGSGTGANSITLDVYTGPALVEPAYMVVDNGVYTSVVPGGGGSN